RSDEGSDELRDDVFDGGEPVYTPGRGQRDGHGGIDVGAGDLANRIDHRHDDKPEGQGDDAKIGEREGGLGATFEGERRSDRSSADQGQQASAKELRSKFLYERWLVLHRLPPATWQSRKQRDTSTCCVRGWTLRASLLWCRRSSGRSAEERDGTCLCLLSADTFADFTGARHLYGSAYL